MSNFILDSSRRTANTHTFFVRPSLALSLSIASLLTLCYLFSVSKHIFPWTVERRRDQLFFAQMIARFRRCNEIEIRRLHAILCVYSQLNAVYVCVSVCHSEWWIPTAETKRYLPGMFSFEIWNVSHHLRQRMRIRYDSCMYEWRIDRHTLCAQQALIDTFEALIYSISKCAACVCVCLCMGIGLGMGAVHMNYYLHCKLSRYRISHSVFFAPRLSSFLFFHFFFIVQWWWLVEWNGNTETKMRHYFVQAAHHKSEQRASVMWNYPQIQRRKQVQKTIFVVKKKNRVVCAGANACANICHRRCCRLRHRRRLVLLSSLFVLAFRFVFELPMMVDNIASFVLTHPLTPTPTHTQWRLFVVSFAVITLCPAYDPFRYVYLWLYEIVIDFVSGTKKKQKTEQKKSQWNASFW